MEPIFIKEKWEPDYLFLDGSVNLYDIDFIFTLTKSDWNQVIRRLEYPEGWQIQIVDNKELNTPYIFVGNNAKGTFIHVQPLYIEVVDNKPSGLILGVYYNKGLIPQLDNPDSLEHMQSVVQSNLENKYTINIEYKDVPPRCEGLVFKITSGRVLEKVMKS